jgi:hypothetical protein
MLDKGTVPHRNYWMGQESVSRGGRDRRALDVMDATGTSYSTALAEVKRRRDDRSPGDYMIAVRSLLQQDRYGDPNADRCVRCLKSRHGGRCA